ncbi:MAG: S9 family peptidase, partial [Acidobacteriota bacterium]
MKRFLLALVVPALLAACTEPATEVEESVADGPRDVPEHTIEQFLDTVSYGGASFSPDRTKLLVSSDETGVSNAYALPVDGGPAEQLTESEESVSTVGYFPNDERFLFQSDQGGNELFHIYVRELDGTITDLTPGEKERALFLGWAPDGASFYYGSNVRDPRFTDVYAMTTDTYEATLLYENTEGYDFGAITADRTWMALFKTQTRADSDVYLYHLPTQKLVHVTPHEGDVNHFVGDFSLDGQRFYIVTDQDSEFLHLNRYDLTDFDGETIPTPETVLQPDWDVAFAYVSRGGRYMIAGINNDGRTELQMFEESTMTPVSLPELGGAEVTSVTVSPDDQMMAFYASTSRTPRDLYVQTIGSSDAPRQLTRSLNAAIDAENLVEGKVVRFASFDGLEIPGILYKPHRASADNKVPALLWVHGGPGGQSRLGY